jgi:FAD synthase
MQVHYYIEQLPGFKKAIITIGTFDGVHSGHQQIIDAMRKESKKKMEKRLLLPSIHTHAQLLNRTLLCN